MSGDQALQLQVLLDRLQQGDPTARTELIEHAFERLRWLVRRIFHADFPRLRHEHDTDSILNQSAVRLWQSFQEVQPPTVCDFFRFAAAQIRRVLIDIARCPGRESEHASPRDEDPPGRFLDTILNRAEDPTDNPERMAMWTEFHEKVEQLPGDEREVFEGHWYFGLSQAEVARQLGLHEREVSRRWVRAKLRLIDWLPGLEDLVEDHR